MINKLKVRDFKQNKMSDLETTYLGLKFKNPLVAASTGIHDGSAAIKQILAGAQIAQLCSTFYLNGAGVVSEMLGEFSAFMNKCNFKNIEDFRCRLSYIIIPDPMVYECTQFMKYYSNRK